MDFLSGIRYGGPMSGRGREEPTGVIAKAAALLDQLAEEGESTAARLGEALGEPRTTVYRLIRSLADVGFVERGSQRGTYRLGLRLFRLGGAVVARFDERQAALPHMEHLNDVTGETVFLCVRRGLQAVCIERIEGSHVVSLALRLGGALPLHAGAAPRVLLAAEPRAEWDRYCESAGELESFTPATPSTREHLHEELEAARRRGYSVSDGDVTVGIAALGAPIRNVRGTVTAALSISGVRETILGDRAEEMVALVTSAADAVSIALGFDPRMAVACD
jgi:DNA-binding IclR family transcriptional regulator